MTEKDREPPVEPSRRDELIREEDRHPSPEAIAGLLDPERRGAGELRLRAHLMNCRRCFGLYAELAQTQLDWRWGERARAVPAELIATAKQMAVPTTPRPQWRTAGFAAAAALAVVASSGLWFASTSRDRRALEPVRAAVSEVSRTGMTLTHDVAPAGPALRATGVADPRALSRALDELARRYDQAGSTEETAYWLAAGMMAEGDPGARAILAEAVERYPKSWRLANLSAVLDYREGRLADAERKLGALLERRPRDPVASFNRALLLKEQGRRDELAGMGAHLSRAVPPGTPLAARVKTELISTSSR
jgi:hypothetical protein